MVDAGGVFHGSVRLADILANEGEGEVGETLETPETAGGAVSTSASAFTVSGLARRVDPLLTPGTSVWSAMERMGDFVGENIPVLEEGGGGRMLGVVSEAAVVKAYRDAMNEIRREENAGV